ncbi:MAG: EamA family transporter [Fibrobacter sp.]|jgi:transporter family protein|nr:EamA family transporter [Fibrobacter sp.]
MSNNSWVIYALLSAFFAALTSILAKIGIENVNSNLATAIRTIVILVLAWMIVFVTGKQSELASLSGKSLVFLILSGLATGASWLFYFKALQMGEASKVIPVDKLSLVFGMVLAFIVLKEVVTAKAVIGGVLIAVGTLVLVL